MFWAHCNGVWVGFASNMTWAICTVWSQERTTALLSDSIVADRKYKLWFNIYVICSIINWRLLKYRSIPKYYEVLQTKELEYNRSSCLLLPISRYRYPEVSYLMFVPTSYGHTLCWALQWLNSLHRLLQRLWHWVKFGW